ncbi:MAG TPA: hypothetical protein PLL88_10390 [Anaerolineaceae bacterium]|nr:hypothetical protein [Anaerolineaceae bacterium]
MTAMKSRAFLKYQSAHYFLRWRWLLPIPVGLCLGYWAQKVISVLTPPFSSGLQGNALEAFIWAFGKPEIIYFVISILFIFLVSDLLPENSYGQQVLLRLRSRKTWWLGKTIFVFLSTLVYAFLLIGSFFLPVLMKYPISTEWSAAGVSTYGIGLGYSLKNGSPLQAFGSILSFLLIGWFAIGLFIQIVNLISQHRWVGFFSGVLIVICASLGDIKGGPIGGEGIGSFFLLQNHLEFTPLWAPVRVIPEIYSWLFWLIWILACLGSGFMLCKKIDFFLVNHQED